MVYRLRKDDVAARRVGEEYFVLTLGDSTLHNVTGAGARVLELLEEGLTSDEIRARLAEEYDVAEETLDGDLTSFWEELAAKGIVERTDT